MEYKIIRGSDPVDLTQAVNKSLSIGWELYERTFYVPMNPLEALEPQHPWAQGMILPTDTTLPEETDTHV